MDVRHLLVLLLVLSLSVSGLAQSIEVWMVWMQEIVEIFRELTEEEFTPKTGIHVEFSTIPGDSYEQRYLLAAASGAVPDIGVMGSLGPADLGVRGAVKDLRSAYPGQAQALEAQIFPGLLRSLQFHGASFGLPIQFNIYPLYYRQDILDQLGLEVPHTWVDLYQILPRLQARDMNFGLAFGMTGATYADMSMFIWQHGADWYSEDRTRSGLDTPGGIQGFQEFVALFRHWKVPTEAQRFMGFRDGGLPLMTGSSFDYPNISAAAPELAGKWGIALAPGTLQTDGSIDHSAYIGGNTLAIFNQSKNPEAAWAFVEWYLSDEVQGRVSEIVAQRLPNTIYVPANRSALDRLPILEGHRQVFIAQAMQSKAPAYALSPESVTHRYLHFAANLAVVQGRDPEESLRQAAQQMNTELLRKQQEFSRFLSKLGVGP